MPLLITSQILPLENVDNHHHGKHASFSDVHNCRGRLSVWTMFKTRFENPDSACGCDRVNIPTDTRPLFTKAGQGARGHDSLGHAGNTPHCRSHRLDKRPSLTKGFSSKTQSQNALKHTAQHASGRGAAKWNPSRKMNKNN